MKIKDSLINTAIQALLDSDIITLNSNGIQIYPKEFKGYISSFGASMIQSGLLPAVIFYENSENASADRALFIRAIILVLNRELGYNIDEDELFSTYIRNHQDNKSKLTADVNKAAIALKLALRVFKRGDIDNSNEEED